MRTIKRLEVGTPVLFETYNGPCAAYGIIGGIVAKDRGAASLVVDVDGVGKVVDADCIVRFPMASIEGRKGHVTSHAPTVRATFHATPTGWTD